MGSISPLPPPPPPPHTQKPHAVLVPFPLQGHINPFMELAKLLRCNGFHITFVNTEFNHKRLIRSLGPEFVKGIPDFEFETIPDGLPESNKDASQDIVTLCLATRENCYAPFKELINKLNSSSPHLPVTCIIADGNYDFAGRVANELGIPEIQFWTASSCGFVGYLQFEELVKRGIFPFKDERFTVDGMLDTSIDWISGIKDIRFKDLPSFMRNNDLNEVENWFNFMGFEAQNCLRSSTVIINTFEELEDETLDILRAKNPNIYCIGPLHMLGKNFPEKENGFKANGSSLWKNDPECIKWLNKWKPNSVLYINYGSITVMTKSHLNEFAWGIANSKLPFLWIMRSDAVMGEETITLPQEFLDEVKDRGYITNWCSQDQVLSHTSVGGFLTHCGWNSTLETISSGVPTLCWPFFAEQPTNCRFLCNSWKMGLEINADVKREELTELVIELMKGEKGKEMRQKSLEWKKKAANTIDLGGSSYNNFYKLIKVLHYNSI